MGVRYLEGLATVACYKMLTNTDRSTGVRQEGLFQDWMPSDSLPSARFSLLKAPYTPNSFIHWNSRDKYVNPWDTSYPAYNK